MKSPSLTRGQLVVPFFFTAGLAVGASALGYYFGQALAYVSLVFGVLFFAFAARYYVATVSVLLAPSVSQVNGKNGTNGNNGNGSAGTPMVSVHLALYNEERVVDRLLTACTSFDYPNYEVIVVDDSRDGTVPQLKEWILKGMSSAGPRIKIFHRDSREGFKGGALNEALRHTSPKAEYVVVFDADFVPGPDTLKKFLAYFGKHANGNGEGGRYPNGKLAAVQGYQWHALNRTENWLTRGVSCEFSGNYMVDRTFQEVTGVMKMVAGSVYMVRADVLREFGWTGSITEDWELTLRLYERGYKVLYTPMVQAPAECPSTLGKLVRQRMRWAEGHTYNVKKHFIPVLTSPLLGVREKLEFLYFAPYYLQSVFLILGTFSWLTSDILLGAKLPFYTAEFGWGLVLTNLLALPLMSLAGLFLEKRARKDFRGLASQLLLIYALSPYQAFAALKGLLEPVEGSWVRTFKSGRVAGFPGKLEPRKVIKNVLPPRKSSALPKVAVAVLLGVSVLFAAALVQGASGSSGSPPAYYFYDQYAPAGYSPFSSTPAGSSFLMHLTPPPGPDASSSVGSSMSTGLFFYSDPAPGDTALPYGASVSAHLWVYFAWPPSAIGVDGQGTSSPEWQTTTCNLSPDWTQTCTGTTTKTTSTTTSTTKYAGDLEVKIGVYNPATNTIGYIQGADQTEQFPLSAGVNYYQASWGNFGQNQVILKGETLVVSIWCPNCSSPPTLVFNSPAHPSNIDFPIEVPENALGLVGVALVIPGVAGMVMGVGKRGRGEGSSEDQGGQRRVQTILIVAAALMFLSLPLVLSFNDLLASVAGAIGFDRVASMIAPYEASAASWMLRGFGLAAGSSASTLWLSGGFVPVSAAIDWNCVGWQSFFLFGLTSAVGAGEVRTNRRRMVVVLAGVAGVFAVNVLRIFAVVLLGYYLGYPAALILHNYGGAIMTLGFLLAFWTLVMKHESGAVGAGLREVFP